jgi:Cupin-like domain
MHRNGTNRSHTDGLRSRGNVLGLLALSLTVFFLATQTLLHTVLDSIDIGDGSATTPSTNRILGKNLLKTKFGPGSSQVLSQRAQYERRSPPSDSRRIASAIEKLRVPPPATHLSSALYDVHNCPKNPPAGYPQPFLLVDQLLRDWSVDDTDIPNTIYQSICVFDWETDEATALRYREAEVPFVVRNHPELLKASERWNSPGYMQSMIGPDPVRTEYSKNNHLKFWRKPHGRRAPKGWEPPEVEVKMTYDEFLKQANALEQIPPAERPGKEHWYFRLNANKNGPNTYLYEELPIFVAGNSSTFFMVRPEQERGINCRLGMVGNIAEMHFDPMRNFVVVMGGQRRYIVAHPNQCVNAELHPYGHPSCRHSRMNFSNPPGPEYNGPFRSLMASELVIQAGTCRDVVTAFYHSFHDSCAGCLNDLDFRRRVIHTRFMASLYRGT